MVTQHYGTATPNLWATASRLRSPERLPRREVEVCALILFGVSTMGIASRLNIGEETVKTYRKRAYQRLGKATQRELLNWYIERWGQRSVSLN